MARLNLFLKGNGDLHDTLHSCRIGGKLVWNGVNEVLRDSHPNTLIRLRHETWTHSAALLEAAGAPPPELVQRGLPLGVYTAASQFSTALFDSPADAIILSVQPDITSGLFRHRESGYLLFPYGCEHWPQADQLWLKKNFQRMDLIRPEGTLENFIAIIDRLRATSAAPILVFNVSPIVPGETTHCFQGLDETLSTRIKKFNLALIELSARTGVSIIDVEAIIARAGAQTHKLDAMHLTPAGHRLVAEEVVRVLNELGVFDAEAEVACTAA